MAHKGGSGRNKEICKSGRYLCQVCMYASLHSPPFFCTPPRVYGIIFTPSIVFFFLWVSLVGMQQDLLSFFCNRRRS